MKEEIEDVLRYRHLSVAFWDDERIRDLCSDQKLLAVHLITGPHHTSLPGLFCVGRAQLAEQLRWTIEALDVAWAGLDTWTLPDTMSTRCQTPFGDGVEVTSESFPNRRGHLHYPFAVADWSARIVWMPMSVKHAPPPNPSVVTHWRKCFDELPNCALKRGGISGVRAHLLSFPPSFLRAFDLAFDTSHTQASHRVDTVSPSCATTGKGNRKGNRKEREERTEQAGATTKRAKRQPSPAEAAYALQYATGIQAGTGHPFHCPASVGAVLGPAMALHALSEPDHAPLTGEPLLGWLRATSEEFGRAKGHEAQFWKKLAPSGFVDWLNAGKPDQRTGGRNGKVSTAQVTEDRELADMLIAHGRRGYEMGQED